MMLVRRACTVVLACACAVAGLAGCSSPVTGYCSCPAPAKPAFALDVTTAGRVRWQVPLGPPVSGLQVSPLAVGAVAVFVQDDVLYGLRLADGHRLWSRAIGQSIAGMWRWQNLVVVLTQPRRLPLPVLSGLDASTGQARWTLPVAEGVDDPIPTADGGLAFTRGDGVLEVVDLSSGRVRWTRPVASNEIPPVAVGGDALLFVANNLTSYDDRTGKIRWTDSLMPIQLAYGLGELSLQAAAGLAYLTGVVKQGVSGQSREVLLGISAADGHVKWRFVPSRPETLGNYAAGLMSVTSGSGGIWQDELDPATGRVRWRVVSPQQAIATPAGIVTAPGPDQISVHDALTGQTRWTARLSGGWQPLAPVFGYVAWPVGATSRLPVFPAGRFLVVPAGGPDGSGLLAAFRMSDGHRAWQVTIRGPVGAPLSAAPGGMLVYTGIAPSAS